MSRVRIPSPAPNLSQLSTQIALLARSPQRNKWISVYMAIMTLIQNVRYALRVLAKNPSFTAAAVLCLALGIGATTAIFSVVNAVVLRPLPYAQSNRLVRVFTEFPNFPNGGLRHFWLSPPEYLDLKRDAKSYEEIEGWVNGGVNLAGVSEPVRAQAGFVTGGLLNMLGVQPMMGRLLTPADDDPTHLPQPCFPMDSGSAHLEAKPAFWGAIFGSMAKPARWSA